MVKVLNTTNVFIQVDPGRLAGGNNHLFVSDNDQEARNLVAGYLRDRYGWRRVIDLGDMTTARGAEMLLPMWLRLFGVMQTPMYNFRIVSEKE
ncbi:MAG: hypothetical protein ISF22_09440 [Methanomassiliicoccus sp.]|nr:hypothetical protein [Methanomassiliicoccus sp.]